MKNNRMHFWTVGLIIISFVLTTWLSVNSLNTVIEGNDEELSKVLTSKIYDSINNMLTEPIIVSQTMASDYYLIEPLKEENFPNGGEGELITYLSTITNNMDYSSAFVVSEKSRAYYTQEGFNKFVSPKTDSHDIWYSLFVDSGKKYDFDVDTDEVHDDAWTVFVNCRIEDEDGEFLGVCGVSVVMTEIQDILCTYEEEYGIKINLINRDGLVQVDTDMLNIENVVLDIDLTRLKDSADYYYQEEENEGYSVIKYVESLGWYLVVQSDGGNNGEIYSNLIYKNIIAFVAILMVCIFMVSSNITIEKKKMEEHALEKEQYAKEQEALKAQAEAASKAKGEFLANMSHEIRTPINAVLGMDEMILRECKEPKIREYATDIKRAGSMLLSLINDILDFSKIESGKMDIIPTEYNLGVILNESIDMIRPRAEKKNIQVEVNINPDTPVHLYGDEVRVKQIVSNILTNAVKYTQEGRVTLTVSVSKASAENVELYVSVKDTGIGIKEEDMARLFDSFQRVDESRNRSIEGTGLGLSITMRLLNLMGSRLEVKSTYGEGSDFYFYLEQGKLDNEIFGEGLQKYCEDDKGWTHTSEGQFYAPDARILVVDDNEMNLKVFLGLLKNHGMEIDTAMSGKECLALVEQKAYHIIFMDYLMPEMDGVETLKKIRALENNLSKDAVIIALTADAVAGARENFLKEGFCDYLSKPIVAAKLEKMIQEYLPDFPASGTVLAHEEGLVGKPSDKKLANAQIENDIVDWETGRTFCMGSEDFYREMLQTFLDSRSDVELMQYFEVSDFENYRIKIHAIKTNLANIGATKASEIAKRLELALKNENDVLYVQEHHEEFLVIYRSVVVKVEEYVRH